MQAVTEHSIQIPPLGLYGDLVVPDRATGIILFAHGSGSSRQSVRNRYVAGILQEGGFGTLLMDLLTGAEEQVDLRTGHLRFDIRLLGGRLLEAIAWLEREPSTRGLLTGLFGASTGGGAALVAAAERPSMIHAVVSRGGRPDLAGPALARVKAPILLIVGGADDQVIRLNQLALGEMRCKKELAIVPGATHLFEEPGALERVSEMALNWFHQHLKPGGPELQPEDELG